MKPERQTTGLGPACLAWLRELGTHVESQRRGFATPHAGVCAFCNARLEAAIHQAGILATRPQIASELRSPKFMMEVQERLLDDLEIAPVGRFLEAAMAPGTAPPEMPWPGIDLGGGVARSLAIEHPPLPAWLWATVRDEIREEMMQRRSIRRWRRFRTTVAACLLLAGLAGIGFLAVDNGTQQPLEIVMERVPSLASQVPFSSVAVLRIGDSR